MTIKFGLIACSKSKQGKDQPDQIYKAKNLYNSWLFDGRMKAVENHCEEWAIMSAKHGFVAPDDELTWYDKQISELSADEQHALAESVATHLPDNVDTLMVLMGRDYFEPLTEALPEDITVWDPLKGVGLFDQRSELKELAMPQDQQTLSEI